MPLLEHHRKPGAHATHGAAAKQRERTNATCLRKEWQGQNAQKQYFRQPHIPALRLSLQAMPNGNDFIKALFLFDISAKQEPRQLARDIEREPLNRNHPLSTLRLSKRRDCEQSLPSGSDEKAIKWMEWIDMSESSTAGRLEKSDAATCRKRKHNSLTPIYTHKCRLFPPDNPA